MRNRKWRRQFSQFCDGLPKVARDDVDLALSAFLRADLERKRKLAGRSLHARRAGKRAFLRKRAQILRRQYGRGQRKTITDPDILLYRCKDDLLRDSLSPLFRSRYKNMIKRHKVQTIGSLDLSDFSFKRNPAKTMSAIRELVRLAATHTDIRLNFTDAQCDDVAPYMVLAHILNSLPPVISGGTIKSEVTSVIQAVGLDRALGIGRVMGPRLDAKTILPFKMARRAPPGFFGDADHQLRPQYKEFIADRFCQTLEDWLSASDYDLTEDGALLIVSAITEALDNAERHGHPKIDDGMGDWTMAGFSRLVDEDGDLKRLECSVSIVSVGSTISESLATAGQEVATRIDNYVSAHTDHSRKTDEKLRTVAALQDGITRVAAASDEDRGGVGLLTLVDFFGELGETDDPGLNSVFTIISGNSCLRMTAPYRMGVAKTDDGMRELWLNPPNDDKASPDSKHAFSLEDRFSGTILSACFSIDREFLKRKFAA